jgi:hypothetical protein
MCYPLLALGSLTLASGYLADETVQPAARKRASGWRLIRRAVGRHCDCSRLNHIQELKKHSLIRAG